jgi:hypothetical protein
MARLENMNDEKKPQAKIDRLPFLHSTTVTGRLIAGGFFSWTELETPK